METEGRLADEPKKKKKKRGKQTGAQESIKNKVLDSWESSSASGPAPPLLRSLPLTLSVCLQPPTSLQLWQENSALWWTNCVTATVSQRFDLTFSGKHCCVFLCLYWTGRVIDYNKKVTKSKFISNRVNIHSAIIHIFYIMTPKSFSNGNLQTCSCFHTKSLMLKFNIKFSKNKISKIQAKWII